MVILDWVVSKAGGSACHLQDGSLDTDEEESDDQSG